MANVYEIQLRTKTEPDVWEPVLGLPIYHDALMEEVTRMEKLEIRHPKIKYRVEGKKL